MLFYAAIANLLTSLSMNEFLKCYYLLGWFSHTCTSRSITIMTSIGYLVTCFGMGACVLSPTSRLLQWTLCLHPIRRLICIPVFTHYTISKTKGLTPFFLLCSGFYIVDDISRWFALQLNRLWLSWGFLVLYILFPHSMLIQATSYLNIYQRVDTPRFKR